MQSQSTIAHAQTDATAGILVHLGAGLCSELEAHLALQPPRGLLLVEADPQLAEELKTRTAGMPRVQVICAAVSGQAGPATFYRYNLPDAGSLHPAAGLHELFPGLRLVEQTPVETVNPVALLEPLALDAAQDNILVVDLNGEELPVLETLRQAGMLQRFCRIRLCCGRRPLYEGGESAEGILGWLEKLDFELLAEDDSRDPDRPVWTLRRSVALILERELRRVQLEKEGFERTCGELQTLLAEQQRRTDYWQQEHGKLAAESERLGQESQSLRDGMNEIQALLAEQQRQTEFWRQDSDRLKEEIGERDQRIARLAESCDRAEVLNALIEAEHKNKVEQIEQESQSLRDGIEALRRELDEQKRQTEHWLQETGQLKTEKEQLGQESQSLRDGAEALRRELDEQKRQTEHWLQEADRLKGEIERLGGERQALETTLGDLKLQLVEQQRQTEYWLHANAGHQEEAEGLKKRIEQLEQEYAEKNTRQRLMDEELLKAEAQIDLIKDILIREKAF